MARHLSGYGELALPHCTCDARKDGHVIAAVGATSFKLQACREDGSPEVLIVLAALYLYVWATQPAGQ